MKKNAIHFVQEDDETLEILFVTPTGKVKPIAYANHDEHGWAGMSEIENAVRQVAKALKIKTVDR